MARKGEGAASAPTLPDAGPCNRSQPDFLDNHPPIDDDNDGLPGYSAVSSSTINLSAAGSWQNRLHNTPGLPPVDILQYLPENATLSDDQTTITVTDQRLCTDPAALTAFISAQAALPPRPQIRITGTGTTGVDFDIRIDMMRYFIRPRGNVQWNYVKTVERHEMAFRGETTKTVKPHYFNTADWVRRFCKSAATNKAFVLEREYVNWNTEPLEGRIRNLLASLRYQGKINISFAASHTHVAVKPPPSGLIPQFLSFLTTSKKFAVIRSIWPYANMFVEERGGARRECALQDEDEWWEVWSSSITLAVMSKRKGWVTTEDVMDMAMCLKNQPVMKGMSWS